MIRVREHVALAQGTARQSPPAICRRDDHIGDSHHAVEVVVLNLRFESGVYSAARIRCGKHAKIPAIDRWQTSGGPQRAPIGERSALLCRDAGRAYASVGIIVSISVRVGFVATMELVFTIAQRARWLSALDDRLLTKYSYSGRQVVAGSRGRCTG